MYSLEIKSADGTLYRCKLSNGRQIVGNDGGSDIRIEDTCFESAPLLLAPLSEGCWVSLNESSKLSIFFEGSTLTHGVIPWGSSAWLGKTELRFQRTSSCFSSLRKIHPLTWAAGVAVSIFAGWTAVDASQDPIVDGLPRLPTLDIPSHACPADPQRAGAAANELVRKAHAKTQRYAFDPSEALSALELYGKAVACLEGAGDSARLRAAKHAREQLGARIRSDLATGHLRLQMALKDSDYARAHEQLSQLTCLLDGLDGPYVDWLAMLKRRLPL